MHTLLSLLQMLQTLVSHARTGHYGDAASVLNQAMATMQTVVSGAGCTPQRLKKIAYSLETMVLLQQSGDWVGVADVVEFELIPLLMLPSAA
jgi:hypothetical protein